MNAEVARAGVLALGLVAGLAVAAFFAACEGAFLSLTAPPGERPEAGAPNPRVARLLGRPDRLQHAIALGHLLAVVWVAALAWQAARTVAGGPLGVGFGVATALGTAVLLLVVADLTPKALGMARPAEWSRRAALVLTVWQVVLTPVTAVFFALAAGARRVVGAAPAAKPLSSTDVHSLVADSTARTDLAPGGQEMITSIFHFGETTVREVMTPRPDIVGIEVGTPWPEALRRIGEAEHSRVPVYAGTLDTIVGVLYAKDLLAIVHHLVEPPADLRRLLAPATFVPEAKKIDDLLRAFQRERIHLGIVVDEYGGTAGLVTLEDILEELVGEIQDENDRERPLVEALEDGSLRLDGRLNCDDFDELTGSRVTADGVETVGGLVLRELGRVPQPGDVVERGGWAFAIEAVDGKRVTTVRARRFPTAPDAGPHP